MHITLKKKYCEMIPWWYTNYSRYYTHVQAHKIFERCVQHSFSILNGFLDTLLEHNRHIFLSGYLLTGLPSTTRKMPPCSSLRVARCCRTSSCCDCRPAVMATLKNNIFQLLNFLKILMQRLSRLGQQMTEEKALTFSQKISPDVQPFERFRGILKKLCIPRLEQRRKTFEAICIIYMYTLKSFFLQKFCCFVAESRCVNYCV